MGQASGASYNKAFFTNVDTKSVFYVQFNPKEFKLDEKANWKASDEHEADKPLLTYEKGEPTSVTMDLIFDSTDTGANVYDLYVMPLRDFLTSDVTGKDKNEKEWRRPPYCKFTWGSFTFDCVIEKVSASFLMFKPDGTPLRAKVQLGLKERDRRVPGGSDPEVSLVALGSMVSGAKTNASTYISIPGDTITSIAQRFKAKAQDIALANNIPDPIEIEPGTRLVIPANGELAAVLARQSLQHTPAFWTNDRKLDPFEVPTAQGGDTQYVPSALEEDGPVALDYETTPGDLAVAYASFGATYGGYGDSAFTFGATEAAEYGDYGESDFTFGRSEAQTFGDYGDSEAIDTTSKGADYGGFGDSAGADAIGTSANPLEQGATNEAQTFGDYGDSEAIDTSSHGAEAGGHGASETIDTSSHGAEAGGHAAGSAADAIGTSANPLEQGATNEAQSYGGYGDSEAIDTSSHGAEAGGHGASETIDTSSHGAAAGGHGASSAADAIGTSSNPVAQGAASEAQGYGGHGASDAAISGASGAAASGATAAGLASGATAGHAGAAGGGGDSISGASSAGGGVAAGAASSATSRANDVIDKMHEGREMSAERAPSAASAASTAAAAARAASVATAAERASSASGPQVATPEALPSGMALGEAIAAGKKAADETEGEK